jgi:hypothetical protein
MVDISKNDNSSFKLSGAAGTVAPRLMTRTEVAHYCRLTPSALSSWIKRGLLPGPIAGTSRWDSKAIDNALDLVSGLSVKTDTNSLDQWRSKRARKSEGNS